MNIPTDYSKINSPLMGKNDNIRRAKKLKAAKRQRELEMEFQNDMIGNVDALINRNNGAHSLAKNDFPIKYSAIILDFLTPFLDSNDSESTTKQKITVGIYLWNLAVEEQLDMVDENENKSLKKLLSQIEFGQELFDDLLTYKKTNFSEYDFIVADFIIGKAKKGMVQLSVVASVLEENER